MTFVSRQSLEQVTCFFCLVSSCNTLYFDSHYHAYIISVSSHQSLIFDLFDYNVYHGHKLTDDLTRIIIKDTLLCNITLLFTLYQFVLITRLHCYFDIKLPQLVVVTVSQHGSFNQHSYIDTF